MSTRQFFIVAGAILLLSLVLHLGLIEVTPWDWDEPVYTSIAQATQALGYPSFGVNNSGSGNGDLSPGWYPYHPPFHFYLLAQWYQLTGSTDIHSGRTLSAIIATLTVGAAGMFTSFLIQKKEAALPVMALLTIDGWFLYSSGLVKLDTASMLVGTLGLCCYLVALKGRKNWWILAGLLLGFAAIYKHVAVLHLLVVVLSWLVSRLRSHLDRKVLLVAGMVIVSYVLIMIVTVGEPYIEASTVQIHRSLGIQASRGLNYGWEEALRALGQTYYAFGGSVALIGFALLINSVRVLQHLRGKEKWLIVLTMWWGTTSLFLIAVRLRNPHYVVFLLIVSAITVGIEMWKQWQPSPRQKVLRVLVLTVAILLVGLDLRTLAVRITQFGESDSFRALQDELANMPANSVILSEEPVCALVLDAQQRLLISPEIDCYKIGNYQSEGSLNNIQPTLIVAYTTITQRLPDSPALVQLLGESHPVWEVKDWKSAITILEVPLDYWVGEDG